MLEGVQEDLPDGSPRLAPREQALMVTAFLNGCAYGRTVNVASEWVDDLAF